MSTIDLLEDLRRRPFEPIRLFLTDGTVYDIRHPEQCMLGIDTVIVGLAADPSSMRFERLIRVSCDHIVKVEPIRTIPPAATAG